MEEIRASLVIEMMGRPVEHLKETMKELLKKLSEEQGVEIENQKIHKPKVVEQKDKDGNVIKFPEGQELYSNFADVDIKANSLLSLVGVVFAYKPSHIEIISPMSLKTENFDMSTILNEITKRLHQYDAIAKNAIMQNKLLAAKIMEIQNAGGAVQMQEGSKKAKKKSSKKKSSKKK